AIGGHVGPREYGGDARHRSGARDVDSLQHGMGVRRTHEDGIELARAADVVDVGALAGDEAVVFLAPDGGADPLVRHGGNSSLQSPALMRSLRGRLPLLP